MCLSVNEGATFKVAEKDITVYKVGAIYGDSYSSKYRNYCYRKGEIQQNVKLKKEFGQIYKGYHSYTSLGDANLHNRYDKNEKIGVFTIPKGTLYIEGTFVGSKSYVSETLIFNGVYEESLFRKSLRGFLQFFK